MHDEYGRMKGDYAYVQMDFDDFEKWFVKWTLTVNEIKVFVQK